MASTHFRVYDERTGNPTRDNRARRANQQLTDALRRLRVTTPRGRRRKKQLTKATYREYAGLLVHVAAHLAQQDHAGGR